MEKVKQNFNDNIKPFIESLGIKVDGLELVEDAMSYAICSYQGLMFDFYFERLDDNQITLISIESEIIINPSIEEICINLKHNENWKEVFKDKVMNELNNEI